MKIAEIFQLGYGHDRGDYDRKHHDHERKHQRDYHHDYDRHDDDDLLSIKISVG